MTCRPLSGDSSHGDLISGGHAITTANSGKQIEIAENKPLFVAMNIIATQVAAVAGGISSREWYMFSTLLKFIRGIGATPGLTFHLEVQDGVGPVIFPNSALTRQNIHVVEVSDIPIHPQGKTDAAHGECKRGNGKYAFRHRTIQAPGFLMKEWKQWPECR